MNSRWLSLIAFIGIALITIGIYSLVRKPQTEVADQPPPAPVKKDEFPGWKQIKQDAIPVDQQWTSVGKYSGKILIVMSGTVILDPNRPPIGPDGISELAPQGFTVPGIVQYCSLGKFNGKVQKIGSYRELDINGELYLGPNEDAAAMHGHSFADNSGVWGYRIFKR